MSTPAMDSNDPVITNEPEKVSTSWFGLQIACSFANSYLQMYCNLTHEQMRDNKRISYTDEVSDKLYQFCASNNLSRYSAGPPDVYVQLMRYIGFDTEDSEVFENALVKIVRWIGTHINPDAMPGLVEESRQSSMLWEVRTRAWLNTWQAAGYSVSISGKVLPQSSVDQAWNAARRVQSKSEKAIVSQTVSFKKANRGVAGPGASKAATAKTTPDVSVVESPLHKNIVNFVLDSPLNDGLTYDEISQHLNGTDGLGLLLSAINQINESSTSVQADKRSVKKQQELQAELTALRRQYSSLEDLLKQQETTSTTAKAMGELQKAEVSKLHSEKREQERRLADLAAQMALVESANSQQQAKLARKTSELQAKNREFDNLQRQLASSEARQKDSTVMFDLQAKDREVQALQSKIIALQAERDEKHQTALALETDYENMTAYANQQTEYLKQALESRYQFGDNSISGYPKLPSEGPVTFGRLLTPPYEPETGDSATPEPHHDSASTSWLKTGGRGVSGGLKSLFGRAGSKEPDKPAGSGSGSSSTDKQHHVRWKDQVNSDFEEQLRGYGIDV